MIEYRYVSMILQCLRQNIYVSFKSYLLKPNFDAKSKNLAVFFLVGRPVFLLSKVGQCLQIHMRWNTINVTPDSGLMCVCVARDFSLGTSIPDVLILTTSSDIGSISNPRFFKSSNCRYHRYHYTCQFIVEINLYQ